MAIQTDAQASQVAALISSGKLTAAGKAAALADLRAYHDAQSAPAEGMGGPAPANTFVDPHTGQPTNPAPLQPFSQIAEEGAVEPARRALAGVEQLGDKAVDWVAGDSSYGDKQTAMETDRRAQWAADHPGTSQGLEDLAGGVISSAVPIGAATKTTTLLGAIAKGAAVGGAGSALQFTPKGDSKTEQTAFGAGAGTLFSALRGAVPAGKNLITRAITKAEQNPRVQEVVNAAKGFFASSKAVKAPAEYSIAQASGDPMVARLSGRAFGAQQQEHGAQQVDDIRARFGELAGQAAAIAKQPVTSPEVAGGINSALHQITTGMKAAKKEAFQKGMSNVLALDSGSPTPVSIGLDNLRHAYSEVIAQDKNAFNIHGATLPAGFQDTLDILNGSKGYKPTSVRLPTLQYIMQGLGQDADHAAGVVVDPATARLEMFRRKLFDGLQADIDAAGVTAGKNPAYAELQKVRQTYAQNSDALRRVQDDSITKLFGSKEALAQPAAALDQFYKLKPEDQQFAVSLLDENHPGVVESMRGNQINASLRAATTNGPANTSDFNLAKFNDLMFGEGRGSSPLWKGGGITASKVREGAAHLRVILNAPAGGPGSVVGPEDLAINVMSRNPAFAARMVTRLAYQKSGDQLLGTSEGLKALRTLTNTTSRTSQAYAAAVAYMTNLATGNAQTQ